MRRYSTLKNWIGIVTSQMPHLSKPQAQVLAMWSFGIAITQSSGISTVSVFLAELLGMKENTVRQRLREWLRDAKDKKGTNRQQIEVSSCFAPLLAWILSQWSPSERKLALAMDATTLGQRFTVLAISVLYRGSAIPIAWKVVKATEKGAWKPYWLELFARIQNVIPDSMMVIVTADRGLYAHWLYHQILTNRWHPYLRINSGGWFQHPNTQQWKALSQVVTSPGHRWSGQIRVFKEHPIDCTLLACWEPDYADPWLIVTDLDPQVANSSWYAMRSWIECSFKDIKRGGLVWHQTKMTDPQRAERHWLAISLSMLWLVSLGGSDEASHSDTLGLDGSTETVGSSRPLSSRYQPPLLSCFRRGFLRLLVALLQGQSIPVGRFWSFPWTGSHGSVCLSSA